MTLRKRIIGHKLNNSGFSLIELIVVIAIMSVFVGGTITFSGLIPKSNLKSCYQMTLSQLSKARVDTMSFGKTTLELSKKTDGIYIKITTVKSVETSTPDVYDTVTDTEETNIGKSDITVKYTVGGVEEELGSTDVLKLEFDRSSGGMKKAFVNGTEADFCTEIKFLLGSYERVITLNPYTGNIQ